MVFGSGRGVTAGMMAGALVGALAAGTGRAVADPVFSHIVVVMQENRTPDNIFGSNPKFEPGVDIATSGLNSLGKTIKLGPVALANCYDISHTHAAFVKMYDGGRMDGANKETVTATPGCTVPANPQFRYVDNSTGTVQPYFDIAQQYGFANRMFQTNQGPSFPAHQFLFGGTSSPSADSPLFAAENMSGLATTAGCMAAKGTKVALIDANGSETSNPQVYPCFERPTLTDRLNAAGLSWQYYTPVANNIVTAPNAIRHICMPTNPALGVPSCTGSDFNTHVQVGPAQFIADIQSCRLASVSWVVSNGASSDHAQTNNGTGPAWVASIVNAIGAQPTCPNGETYWGNTAIFITWDDWGGWYDHVPPFRIGQSNGWGAAYTYGFRVPLLVVSAFTPPGTVDNTLLDFGSLLRFIEVNFGQGLIGAGSYADAYANLPSAFFTATAPRAFAPIASPMTAADFLRDATPLTTPDDY